MCQRDECKGLIVVELLLLAGEAIFVDLERAGRDRLEVERALFDNRDFHCDLLIQRMQRWSTSCAQQDECKGLIAVELLLLAGEAIFVDLERAGCDGLEVERAFFDNRDLHLQSPKESLCGRAGHVMWAVSGRAATS